MNEFEQEIRKALSKQRRLFFVLAGVVGLSALALTGLLTFATGSSIRISPDDAAEIGKVEVIDGFGFAVSEYVFASVGETKILVSALGFRSETRTLAAEEKGGNIAVHLEELPGRLIARTKPENELTKWTIGDEYQTIAERIDRTLKPGTYDLEVNNLFFDVEKREVVISRDQQSEIMINLKPVEGRLSIKSRPSGSEILLNGTKVGMSPLVLTPEGGEYQIEVRNSKFATTTETIAITNSTPIVNRDYRLSRPSAKVKFSLKPPAGILLLNGRKIDPAASYTVNANVEHTATYMHDGFFTKKENFTLSASETKTVVVHLQPELGKVEVRTEPVVTVLVNGTVVGKSPISLELPAIRHAIELRRSGYRSVKMEVLPSSKNAKSIQETLVREDVARLSEALKSYKSADGMAFVLFEPSSYVMGAPRHEIGQRANEFQRKVNLTKPFYAGLHEVTNAQFSKFNSNHTAAGGGRVPVTSVSWLEAVLYCSWLSGKENLEPFYVVENGRLRGINLKANGYRLLTEAEWEWLARRASRSSTTIFTWGNGAVVPSMAGNIADELARGSAQFYVPNYTDGFAGLAPVGSFAAEASGLFDLTGNVSEWVHDFYSLQPPNPNAVEVDPIGPKFGDSHVVKGSNWRSGTRTELRAAYRAGLVDRRDDVGFRIGRYL